MIRSGDSDPPQSWNMGVLTAMQVAVELAQQLSPSKRFGHHGCLYAPQPPHNHSAHLPMWEGMED